MYETVLLCGFAFFAGLVDAIAGGGGLIQVPALFALFPAAPPALLIGTNKFSSLAGTTMATWRYSRSVPIRWYAILPGLLTAAIASLLGAAAVLLIDPVILRPVLVFLLGAVAIYTILRPRLGLRKTPSLEPKTQARLVAVSGGFGFYDGFFGPGAGSGFMFYLVRWFGYDFLHAAATTKVLNLATNFVALVVFMACGSVNYATAMPMAACNLAGGLIGAHLAVRGGNRFIRVAFLLVVFALLAKVIADTVRSA